MKKYLKSHLILILALAALVIATPLLFGSYGWLLAGLWAVWLVVAVITALRDKRAA